MTDSKPDELFVGLIASLQMGAWMHLGKVMNPMTGKVERDLGHAKETIDLLGVLEQKTRGNLHPDEAQLLGRMLYDLRLNYVEEVGAQKAAAGTGSEPPPGAEPATGTIQAGQEGIGDPVQPSSPDDLPGAVGSEGGGEVEPEKAPRREPPRP
jgi:hypothetical protein